MRNEDPLCTGLTGRRVLSSP